jgi:hypothetical protein
MIELKDDKLQFSFPEIREGIHDLVMNYYHETLPLILGEDREEAFNKLLRIDFRFKLLSSGEAKIMRKIVRELSPEKITECFLSAVRSLEHLDTDWRAPGRMSIEFHRTLRIPDDGKDYFLPPGLGNFPLRHIDDYEKRVPKQWLEWGGVLMPMYQSEALWIRFSGSYPFAVKIASGKINAVSGEEWKPGLNREPQDYLIVPQQPWLDGFAVEKGIIRQFVAMPMGSGYSVEEQLTGKAEFGGIQIQVFPMKVASYFQDELLPELPGTLVDILPDLLPQPKPPFLSSYEARLAAPPEGMGLAAGGRMRQQIYRDKRPLSVWDTDHTSRCFVHLCNSLVWREITGTNPPYPPITAREYEEYCLPWFDYYRDDLPELEGSEKLAKVKSVAEVAATKNDGSLIGNASVESPMIRHIGLKERPSLVREAVVLP